MYDLFLVIIVSASVAVALPYGCFSVASMLTSHSDYFYLGGMLSSYALIPIWLLFASVVFGGLTATWIFTLYFVAMMYVRSIQEYSRVVVQQARLEDFDYVDDVLRLVFFHLLIRIFLILMVLKPGKKAFQHYKGIKKEL
ncbi:unnamed protein product [Ilex paraguariensis]|uniref:Uncharacterized protein n=1 Tax=Ilex paraguariensis TaxID=185542 RepID=A0ABC8RWX2_9AQUA